MDGEQCVLALYSGRPDFEDMLRYEAATAGMCDCIIIITRDKNKNHFPTEGIPVYTAEEFLEHYY